MSTKILTIRRHGDEDTVYIIPEDTSPELTRTIVDIFIARECDLYGISEKEYDDLKKEIKNLHLVDEGDFIDIDTNYVQIIAEIKRAIQIDTLSDIK